jgi:mono/diheme cytochrome c family protein
VNDKPIRDSENADPREAYNPVPRVVLGLVAACVIAAVSYIVVQRPNDLAELGDRRDLAALSAAPKGAATATGAQIFTRCAACHQADGHGLPGVFPPLSGSALVLGDPAVITQIVLHGLTGPVAVLGTTYNGAMPAFGDQLSDAEIAAVLSYARSQWGNNAAALDQSFVAAARKQSADRKESWQGTDQITAFVAAGSPASAGTGNNTKP